MAAHSFNTLIMGKVEIGNFCRVFGDILILFTKMIIGLSSRFHYFVQIALFDWLTGDIKVKFSERYSKIFSETIRCMKLKLGIHP